MSDETPTEKFYPPTEPLGPPPQASASAQAATEVSPKSRTLTIVLSVIGGLLLIAVVIVLTLLFSGAFGKSDSGIVPPPASASPSVSPSVSPSASPSPSPSESPSASPSATPSSSPSPTTPPSTGPVFTSFSPSNNTSVGCTNNSDPVAVTFTWSSTGANEAAIGVGVTDAYAGAYETGLPPSGSYTLDYQCSEASQIYTVSIRGSSGQTNKTVTLKR